MSRFYIVVRNDLAPGLQVAQACHAAYAFALWAPDERRENLVVLSAPPARLSELVDTAARENRSHQPFHEPDLDGALTACAFDESVRKQVSSLPLALKQPPSEL